MNRAYRHAQTRCVVALVIMTVALQVMPCGAETNSVLLLRGLLAREDLSKDERAAQLKAHLQGLNKQDFQVFLKAADAADGLFRGEEDKGLSMFFYARWYIEGPGENDSLLETLSLTEDKSLPWRWRWALLDILKPEEQLDLSGEDMSAIVALLRATATDAGNHEELRYSAIEKAGSLLLTQAELVEERVPGAKPMIMNHDDAILRSKQIAENPKAKDRTSVLLREVARFDSDLDTVAIAAAGAEKLQARIAALKTDWRARMSQGDGGK